MGFRLQLIASIVRPNNSKLLTLSCPPMRMPYTLFDCSRLDSDSPKDMCFGMTMIYGFGDEWMSKCLSWDVLGDQAAQNFGHSSFALSRKDL